MPHNWHTAQPKTVTQLAEEPLLLSFKSIWMQPTTVFNDLSNVLVHRVECFSLFKCLVQPQKEECNKQKNASSLPAVKNFWCTPWRWRSVRRNMSGWSERVQNYIQCDQLVFSVTVKFTRCLWRTKFHYHGQKVLLWTLPSSSYVQPTLPQAVSS
jgi:hypothetical protein